MREVLRPSEDITRSMPLKTSIPDGESKIEVSTAIDEPRLPFFHLPNVSRYPVSRIVFITKRTTSGSTDEGLVRTSRIVSQDREASFATS